MSDPARRALQLEYATVGWNVGEAVLTITLGSIAGSLALIAFGASSLVEVFASMVVIWHLRPTEPDQRRTALALRLVGIAFAVLAVALGASAIRDLASGRRAGESWWGVAYLAVTALVMFGLAAAKRRIAGDLASEPLEAEATMTFLDGILSTSTLVGLALNAAWGVWWADPAAALVVAVFAANEARENLSEAREIEAGIDPALES
ncbi:MAG: cation transporter [Acidimicrobiia bacterium]|nr:cation transporter [Acidimicrobiia bacterium]